MSADAVMEPLPPTRQNFSQPQVPLRFFARPPAPRRSPRRAGTGHAARVDDIGHRDARATIGRHCTLISPRTWLAWPPDAGRWPAKRCHDHGWPDVRAFDGNVNRHSATC